MKRRSKAFDIGQARVSVRLSSARFVAAFSLVFFTAMVFSGAMFPQKLHAQAIRFATTPDAPLQLKAGEMVWQQNRQVADLTRGASIRQGGLLLQAQNMQLQMDAQGAPRRLTASGAVQLVDATQQANAATAIYDFVDESLTLSGDVTLTRREAAGAAQKLSGARLAIDTRSGAAQLSGGANNRARIELQR